MESDKAKRIGRRDHPAERRSPIGRQLAASPGEASVSPYGGSKERHHCVAKTRHYRLEQVQRALRDAARLALPS